MLSPDTQYKIYNVATSLPVARNRVEDRSLLPKRVVTLPDGMDPAPWVVQRDGEGYRLQNQGAATTHIDGNLFAPLLDEPPPKSWVLTEQPDAGQGVYTIKAADSDEGWVVDDDNNEPFQQVRIRRLSSSDIPKNELFRFVPSGDF